MKKTFRKISFIMMCVFFLLGLIMSIVAAVKVGNSISDLNETMSYLGSQKVSNPAFGIFITGFILTLCVTAFWAFMLEHTKNVEKTIDTMHRESKGLPALPDSEYSALPSFLQGLTITKSVQPVQYVQPMQPAAPPAAPATPVAPVQPQYAPQQTAQPVQPVQPMQPVQPAQPIQPVQPVQPVPAPQPVPVPAAQPVPQPIPQPVAPDTNADWICECGAPNIAIAKFCSSCGSPRK